MAKWENSILGVKFSLENSFWSGFIPETPLIFTFDSATNFSHGNVEDMSLALYN